MVLSARRLGFIGAGNMARAIGGGLIRQKLIEPSQVMASAPSDSNLAEWRSWGARTTNKNLDIMNQCDVVFIAVKPHLFKAAMETLIDVSNTVRDEIVAGRVFFVSIMAGVTLDTMRSVLSLCLNVSNVHIVRCMPSTPCQQANGCCCYSVTDVSTNSSTSDFQAALTERQASIVEEIFSALGVCRRVAESQMNAACGAFGSGVAFMLTVIDALASAAVRAGLPWSVAQTMAAQTAVGAGQMALTTGRHLCQLRDEVSSPGGTTIAGLEALETAGVRGAIMHAVRAAVERGEQLGLKNDSK